ncbi:MAG: 3-methyl-2-oxobutanoate hydroxymethyltransferase [Anaeromyxobacteraceae bacterium]
MSVQTAPRRHVTIHDLKRMKEAAEPIAVVTAYDATAARLVADAGIDAVLVGDSVGMAVLGHESTLPVTLDQMIHHSAAVHRGLARAGGRPHLIGDMPFGSYQASVDDAVRGAMRLVAEGGVESVKLEGGQDYVPVIQRIVRAGVPVMGHIGLTPQFMHKMGGYVVQGRDTEKAQQLLRDARALEAAGCYAVTLEGIPTELARIITGQLSIPTIGIGAGPHCDGQVLVLNDLLGLDDAFVPKFVKRYAEIGQAITGAVGSYVTEVKARSFPDDAHSYHSSAVRLVPMADEQEEHHDEAAAFGAPV